MKGNHQVGIIAGKVVDMVNWTSRVGESIADAVTEKIENGRAKLFPSCPVCGSKLIGLDFKLIRERME